MRKKDGNAAIAFYLSCVFFIIVTLTTEIETIFANFIMTIVCFIFLYKGYSWKESFFSLNNIIVSVFFGFGCIFRYVFLAINPENAMSFAFTPLENKGAYHFYAALCILIALLSYICGNNLQCNEERQINAVNDKSIQKKIFYAQGLKYVQLIAVFALFFIYWYKLNNIRIATELNYGTYDNAVNFISIAINYIGYISLFHYLTEHNKKSMVFAICCFLPSILISILFGWKGEIIRLSIILIVAYSMIKKNKKSFLHYKKEIIIISLLFSFIYPVISMYRVNLQLQRNYYEYNINSILTYNIENNIARYLTNRFSYYDEIYYVINCDEYKKDIFLEHTGIVHSRFFEALVPRMFNEDKKIVNIGLNVTHDLMGYPITLYNNLTISYIGEIWISYGIIGVAVINFILGYLIKQAERIKRTNILHSGKYLFSLVFTLNFLEGDVVGKIISLLWMFISMYLIDVVIMKFSKN